MCDQHLCFSFQLEGQVNWRLYLANVRLHPSEIGNLVRLTSCLVALKLAFAYSINLGCDWSDMTWATMSISA